MNCDEGAFVESIVRCGTWLLTFARDRPRCWSHGSGLLIYCLINNLGSLLCRDDSFFSLPFHPIRNFFRPAYLFPRPAIIFPSARRSKFHKTTYPPPHHFIYTHPSSPPSTTYVHIHANQVFPSPLPHIRGTIAPTTQVPGIANVAFSSRELEVTKNAAVGFACTMWVRWRWYLSFGMREGRGGRMGEGRIG